MGPEGEDITEIIVVTSVSGPGDKGYNDMIMKGVMEFYMSADRAPEGDNLKFSLIRPDSSEDVARIVADWISAGSAVPPVPVSGARDAVGRSLLVLADSGYLRYVPTDLVSAGEGRHILVFESVSGELPDYVSSFHISRYAISFLAGCMAGRHSRADIYTASATDPILKEAVDGFREGYRFVSGRDANVTVSGGFDKIDEAYRFAADIENTFFLPLSGGANNGIYKATREKVLCRSLVAGMDVDCSTYSPAVPFSIVLDMDRVVLDYLSEWFYGGHDGVSSGLEGGRVRFGLSSGYQRIVINPSFFENRDVFEDYYFSGDFWTEAYEAYYDVALEKDAEYEKSFEEDSK